VLSSFGRLASILGAVDHPHHFAPPLDVDLLSELELADIDLHRRARRLGARWAKLIANGAAAATVPMPPQTIDAPSRNRRLPWFTLPSLAIARFPAANISIRDSGVLPEVSAPKPQRRIKTDD
jgi:hypothetical protein